MSTQPRQPMLARILYGVCGSLFALLLSGCLNIGFPGGIGGGGGGGQQGNTNVTVLLSSAVNDDVPQIYVQLEALTLTNAAGKQVTLNVPSVVAPAGRPGTFQIANPAGAPFIEYIHLNGNSEPLLEASVPADTYVSAQATVGMVEITCVGLDTLGGLSENRARTPATATVRLPVPVSVSGSAMGLALTLNVAQSLAAPNCPVPLTLEDFNPVFTLSAIDLSSSAPQAVSLNETALRGLVTAVGAGGSSVTFQSADDLTFTAALAASTVFQGIASAAGLTTGLPVTADLMIQPDDSLEATRIAVPSTSTSMISTLSGPVLYVDDSSPRASIQSQGQGFLFPDSQLIGSTMVDLSSAAYAVSAAPGLLANLPFTPVFNAQTLIPGQSVLVTTNTSAPSFFPAATVTLEPQTIDGQIVSVASAGQETIYTVTLGSQTLFKRLAVQPNQSSLIGNPQLVTVYAGPITRLNTSAAVQGGLLRFTGLLFDDNGALRMACLEINDGVAQ